MQGLNRESLQSIYFGVSYIIASGWVSDRKKFIAFQNALLEKQLQFSDTKLGNLSFILLRKEQSPLQIKLASVGPQVTNLTITSEKPVYSIELFCKEAEAICGAYEQTWLSQGYQIVQCDATIRHLYSCKDHAFKYLWEIRLGQEPQDFHHLGKRPVLGGGLRLVMPPIDEPSGAVHIEVKVESFFQESKKMFIETLFLWPPPTLLGRNEKFSPDIRLKRVEKYATKEVWDFVTKPEVEG